MRFCFQKLEYPMDTIFLNLFDPFEIIPKPKWTLPKRDVGISNLTHIPFYIVKNYLTRLRLYPNQNDSFAIKRVEHESLILTCIITKKNISISNIPQHVFGILGVFLVKA
ncbi:hypothetical protein Hanom_Chr01g00017811 [Helianthus anomalus]